MVSTSTRERLPGSGPAQMGRFPKKFVKIHGILSFVSGGGVGK
jgi:hypothetical protein